MRLRREEVGGANPMQRIMEDKWKGSICILTVHAWLMCPKEVSLSLSLACIYVILGYRPICHCLERPFGRAALRERFHSRLHVWRAKQKLVPKRHRPRVVRSPSANASRHPSSHTQMLPRMQTHHASDVNMYEALRKRFWSKPGIWLYVNFRIHNFLIHG